VKNVYIINNKKMEKTVKNRLENENKGKMYRPILRVSNDWFGYIERSTYKDVTLEDDRGLTTITPYAYKLSEALSELMEYVNSEDGNWIFDEYPKSRFVIEVVDGTLNKFGDINYKRLMSIRLTDLKKYEL
jgi:hypothetical protein